MIRTVRKVLLLAVFGVGCAWSMLAHAADPWEEDRVFFGASNVWRCTIAREHACGVDGAYTCVERLKGKAGSYMTLRRDRGEPKGRPAPVLQICMNGQCAPWAALAVEAATYDKRSGYHWLWLYGTEAPHLTVRIDYDGWINAWTFSVITDGAPFTGRDMTILSGTCTPKR